ncbi:hypothetical protein OF83DRAFT_1178952 [Amylostereum chailletii]|nr:hypothetical protein OF83DRAFT_1178952 [Amylostereum chailletii]
MAVSSLASVGRPASASHPGMRVEGGADGAALADADQPLTPVFCVASHPAATLSTTMGSPVSPLHPDARVDGVGGDAEGTLE